MSSTAYAQDSWKILSNVNEVIKFISVLEQKESKSIEENNSKIKPQAHSDFIYNKIETYNLDVDVMVEAKMKDLCLLRYLKGQNLLHENA